MAWFLLVHAVRLEQKARRTVRLRAHGEALTVGGLYDSSMFTAKASILPWLLI
jgi:putative hemolysin